MIEKVFRIMKLLSDYNRLSILFTLENGPCSVSEIIQKTGMSQPLISFHLKILKEAGVVVSARKATFVYYSLTDPNLISAIKEFEKYVDSSI